VHPLFDIGYRLAAIALCLSCVNTVWYGLVDRRITFFNTDILDWWTPARQVFHRDSAPVRYWAMICGEIGTAVLCVVAVIFGWWTPNT
jgi:hypothetical protein